MKMMKSILWMMLLLFIMTACTREHFIKVPLYREKVESQFKQQKELAKTREENLFGVLNKKGLSLK